MRKVLLLLLAFLSVTGIAQADTNYPPDNKNVRLTSTNLPIVWMTVNGATIDRYDRITARMKIIHNGNGQLNYADTIAHPGQKVNYEGYVALRYRGNSTFSGSDKKPYSFRPLDKPLEDGGSKKKVDILGMGKDNNWALLAPYSDKSMMRDMLAFEISRPWMAPTMAYISSLKSFLRAKNASTSMTLPRKVMASRVATSWKWTAMSGDAISRSIIRSIMWVAHIPISISIFSSSRPT